MTSWCGMGSRPAVGPRRALLASTTLPTPFTTRVPSVARRRALLVRSSAEDEAQKEQQAPQQEAAEQSGVPALAAEQQSSEAPKRRRRRQKRKEGFTLEDVANVATGTIEMGRKSREAFDEGGFALLNPIAMGRKSREVFDDVWAQLQRLGSSRGGVVLDDDFGLGIGGEFEAPRAPDTLVLVVGATGRVGRILVRKLLLRGYKVRALVRPGREGTEESLPQSVQLMYGDLADYAACRKAVEGVDKVVCCAGARTTLTAELTRVEQQGTANLCRAFLDSRFARARRAAAAAGKAAAEGGDADAPVQAGAAGAAPAAAGVGKVEVVDFKREFYHEYWDIERVGVPESEGAARRRVFDRGQDLAEAYINEDDNLVFTGAVYSRGGIAQVGADLVSAFADRMGRPLLEGTEGLLVNFKGDRHTYVAQLTTEAGHTYTSKFSAPEGYGHARLPFDTFFPTAASSPPILNPAAVNHISFKFEPRQAQPVITGRLDAPTATPFDRSAHSFRLEIDWIKALPGGQETDFVLVSCAGRRPDLGEASSRKVQSYKARGEEALRNSGLGYTIVRPGPLQEEAGGYKALVFDQGNRIRQGISCADVADVCLKALHDPVARNKTFEVCWEYTPEAGLEQYELVAHLPDKSNNYLTPALAGLRKNT